MAKVWFVGTGSFDPELITLKAHKLIQHADAILLADAFVSSLTAEWAKPESEVVDATQMSSQQISDWLITKAQNLSCVIFLQAGDSVLQGSFNEIFSALDAAGIEIGVVPAISLANAAASQVCESLAAAAITHSVIFSKLDENLPTPDGESLFELAQHQCTLCLEVPMSQLDKVQEVLLSSGWDDDAPVLLVEKQSGWQKKIIRGTLTDIKEKCVTAKINQQVVMIVSPALGMREWTETANSDL